MVKDNVDWNDPALQRWLGNMTRPSTIYNYKSAFRAYAQFTGLTASELIDEALEDQKKDIRERQDIVLTRLVKYYAWLKNDYEKKSRGMGEHKIIGKGVTDKSASVFTNCIRSFYSTFDIPIRMRGRHRLPKPRTQNKRMKVGAEQVRLLIDHARTPRDRAIILIMFQGGMDVSTLCSLNYVDVSEGLAKNETPMKLDLHRVKTGVDFYTFLGHDAMNALNAYINDMRSRGVEWKPDTALFMRERGKLPLETHSVQFMLAGVAKKAGLVDKDNNGNSFNPLSPHALRESFGSIMINSGVPDTIVDFWLGHEIGALAEAYKSVQESSLRKMYAERENLISTTSRNTMEKTIRAKMLTDFAKLQGYSDEELKRLEEVLARAKDVDEGIKEFRRMKEEGDMQHTSAKHVSKDKNSYYVAKSEGEMLRKLGDGWELKQPLAGDKFLLQSS